MTNEEKMIWASAYSAHLLYQWQTLSKYGDKTGKGPQTSRSTDFASNAVICFRHHSELVKAQSGEGSMNYKMMMEMKES